MIKNFRYLLLGISLLIFAGCATPVKQIIVGYDKLDKKAYSQYSNIILKIDDQSHQAQINEVILTSDKKEAITVSADKTTRVWDIKSGKEKRKILGEIDAGSNMGRIDTGALSIDDKYLAVGGYLGKGSGVENKRVGDIRVYDYKSGKLIKVLSGYSNDMIQYLKFSKDGKYLFSVGLWSIIMWDLEDFSLKKKISTKLAISRSNIIKDRNDYIIYTHEYNSSTSVIRKYSLKYGLLKTIKSNPRWAYSMGHTKENIVIGYLNSIKFFDYDLNFIKSIKTKDMNSMKLSISDDERYMLVGGAGENTTIRVYDLHNRVKEISSFDKHFSTVHAMAFIDDKTVITAGGTNKDIYIWNIHNGKVVKHIKGVGSEIQTVLRDKSKSKRVGFEWKDKSIKPNYFDMQTKQHGNIDNIKIFTSKHQISKNNIALVRASGAKLRDFHLFFRQNNKDKFYLTRDRVSGLYHTSYMLTDDYIISGANWGSLEIFDFNGNMIYKLYGHIDGITSMAIDGNLLYTGSKDKVINVWDLNKVKLNKPNITQVMKPTVSLFYANNNEWIMWTPEGYFNASQNGHKYIGFHLNKGYEKEAQWIGIEKLYDHFYRPDLVKLALAGEDITKYTKGITFEDVLKDPPPEIRITKVNKKTISNKTVKYNKDSIDLQFNVNQVDNGGVGIIRVYQEGKLVQTIGQGKINRKSANVVEELNSAKLNKKAELEQKEYLAHLDNTVTKSINGTVDINELVQSVSSKIIQNKAGTFNIKLPLKAGKNNIAIEAFNKTNTVVSIRENIIVDANIPKREPTVYAIVAGVNEFESTGRLKNLKYSENDAKAIKDMLKKKIKGKVEVKFLIGKDLTKENLSKAVRDIKKKAKLEDKVIFYISTHGKAIRGNMYLVPQNNKRAKNWIKFEELFKEVQSINALEQVFIVDACESGKAKDIVASIYDSKASVLAKQSGVHILLATTKGTFAFEHPDPSIKHGVFTNNILTALNDKTTDKNQDKKISVIELSKVLNSPKYTAKQQYPVIRNVGNDVKIRDFR